MNALSLQRLNAVLYCQIMQTSVIFCQTRVCHKHFPPSLAFKACFSCHAGSKNILFHAFKAKSSGCPSLHREQDWLELVGWVTQRHVQMRAVTRCGCCKALNSTIHVFPTYEMRNKLMKCAHVTRAAPCVFMLAD